MTILELAAARNTAAPTISSGRPLRPRGVRSIKYRWDSESERLPAIIGVSNSEGAIAFTWTLNGARNRKTLGQLDHAALAGQVCDAPGIRDKPAIIEAMLIILPLFRSAMCLPAAWQHRKVPFKFTLMMVSQFSSE